MLKTDYKNDVLDTSVNDNRKYEMTNNSDGTISLTDVTVYSQEGSLLGANDINEAFTKINKLTAQDGLEFDLQVDEDGNYGMLDKQGEFLSFGGQSMEMYSDIAPMIYGKGTSAIKRKYQFNKKCLVIAMAYAFGISSNATMTVVGGTKKGEVWDYVYSNAINVKFHIYEMEEGGTIDMTVTGYQNGADKFANFVGVVATTDDFIGNTYG